jgi:insecticidal toxin complex protein TccC
MDTIASAGGFKSWENTTIEQAREMAKLFIGGAPDGCPQAIKNYLTREQTIGGKKVMAKLNTLKDMSAYIKYTKDKSTTWISTAVNEACGGQSSGAPIYKVLVDVEAYAFNLIPKTVVATSAYSLLKPVLLMDNPDVNQATVIGLKHGPADDYEVSFFTPIPIEKIQLHKAGR